VARFWFCVSNNHIPSFEWSEALMKRIVTNRAVKARTALTLLILVLCHVSNSPAQSAGTFTPAGNLSGARSFQKAVLLFDGRVSLLPDGRVLIAGGYIGAALSILHRLH